MNVAIIDYGSGNLRSAAKAFERAIADAGLAIAVDVTADPRVVARASHVVLPGVGAFADCRAGLDALDGMVETLQRVVIESGRPFLGICVGMQLMADRGFEHGTHAGLGWIAGDVGLLAAAGSKLKVPHMGWNELTLRHGEHPALAGLGAGAHAYFVHSYAIRPRDPECTLATTDYGEDVAAIVGRDNLLGTQFHPEKSQRTGLTLIANFVRWRP